MAHECEGATLSECVTLRELVDGACGHRVDQLRDLRHPGHDSAEAERCALPDLSVALMSEVEYQIKDMFLHFIEGKEGGELPQLTGHEVGASPLLATGVLAQVDDDGQEERPRFCT